MDNLQCFENNQLVIMQLSKTVGVFVNLLQCGLCKVCSFGHICDWNDKSILHLTPFLFCDGTVLHSLYSVHVLKLLKKTKVFGIPTLIENALLFMQVAQDH